jgi:purine nucleoside phosphorylase
VLKITMSVQIGIIGGSGLYDMAELTDRQEQSVSTPFGDPSGPYVIGTLGGKRVAFLARHGAGHRILPSELNFRANIFAFKVLGVERILSASAVGSLKEEYKPLDILIPDQFFDRTRGRISTFSAAGSWRTSRSRTRCVASSRKSPRIRPSRWARRFTAGAPTSTWKARSFRPWPSRSCTARGEWTSSG